MDHLSPPSYKPCVWVYSGATAEDLYREQDECAEPNLELLASPRCHLVSLSYSIDHVETVARAMWAEIRGLYEEAHECDLSFDLLETTRSARVVERPVGYDRPMEVFEVVEINYFLHRLIEPLLQVIVQKRPLCQ